MCKFFASLLFIFAPLMSWAETQLLMAEEPGCIWCAAWTREIGPIYPKTGEGAAAPLQQVDISRGLPETINLARPVVFTPTFVLLIDGTEVDRFEGYPGDEFFWVLLGQMLTRNDVDFTIHEADGS